MSRNLRQQWQQNSHILYDFLGETGRSMSYVPLRTGYSLQTARFARPQPFLGESCCSFGSEPAGADRGQPAAAWYDGGMPVSFILISQRRSSCSSNSFRIQSQNTENVNSSGKSRPPRCGRATTAHRSTNQRFSKMAATSMNANRTTGSRVVVTPRACRISR